jgi:hypothetical protein
MGLTSLQRGNHGIDEFTPTKSMGLRGLQRGNHGLEESAAMKSWD